MLTTAHRLRNKLSQQAFRRRQTAYIKDLERQLEMRGASEHDQIRSLESENRLLRQQLTTAVTKLVNLQAALKSLTTSMTETMERQEQANMSCHGDSPKSSSAPDDAQVTTPAPLEVQQATEQPEPFDVGSSSGFDAELLSDQGCENEVAQWDQEDVGSWLDQPADAWSSEPYVSPHAPSQLEEQVSLRTIPGVWSYQYQMGPATYRRRMEGQSNHSLFFSTSNSSFSDHIQIMFQSILEAWQSVGPPMDVLGRMYVTL